MRPGEETLANGRPETETNMKLKTMILGGVAAAGLMGASLVPAMAYTHHPGTPAEHQQTDDLNAQQLQQAQSTTSATGMQANAPQSSNQTAMSATTPAAPQTTAQTTSSGQPMTQAANATMPLSTVANPPQTLANASVESSSGQAIGAVQKVILDASGKAQTIVVALLGKTSRLVAIAANQLSFDQSRDVVVAQLSADQIQNLPMAPEG
jgi:hypothetical protein